MRSSGWTRMMGWMIHPVVNYWEGGFALNVSLSLLLAPFPLSAMEQKQGKGLHHRLTPRSGVYQLQSHEPRRSVQYKYPLWGFGSSVLFAIRSHYVPLARLKLTVKTTLASNPQISIYLSLTSLGLKMCATMLGFILAENRNQTISWEFRKN